MAIKLHASFAVHPSAWLRTEIVEPYGLSVTAAAEKLGVTRQAMSNLLNGNAGLSAEMAIRYEKGVGSTRRHADADAGGARSGAGADDWGSASGSSDFLQRRSLRNFARKLRCARSLDVTGNLAAQAWGCHTALSTSAA